MKKHLTGLVQKIWFALFVLVCAAILFPSFPNQEGWVPDYDNRDAWQQPDKIMDAIGIRTGTVVADVGAGKGYFTFKLADRVGPEGKVYATDIDQSLLDVVRNRIQRENRKNIIPLMGKEDDPGLPEGEIDIVLMVHIMHLVINTQDPLVLLENIHPSITPEGRLVLVHWDGKKMGYPHIHAYSVESVLEAVKDSCFELDRIETFLPREMIILLKPKEESFPFSTAA